MPYSLTLGNLHVLPTTATALDHNCDCEEARKGCSPTYVFSVIGQVQFRSALNHITTCQKRDCRMLRTKVMQGMTAKLKWLFAEESLLGCVHVQPYLYGTKHILLQRRHFPFIANHLASCPKESCAQLRRALLLTVREKVRPMPHLEVAPV